MSDLVGNPEDRFSQKEAHMSNIMSNINFFSMSSFFVFCVTYSVQIRLEPKLSHHPHRTNLFGNRTIQRSVFPVKLDLLKNIIFYLNATLSLPRYLYITGAALTSIKTDCVLIRSKTVYHHNNKRYQNDRVQ